MGRCWELTQPSLKMLLVNVTAIIPARYASTRFPAKPLANRTGRFLIQHVYERVQEARRIDRCIVATDDRRIADAVSSFGGHVAMTRTDHVSGTDRIAEVVRATPGDAEDLVLNVQGDEPEIEPAYLDRLIERMLAESPELAPMGTLACPFAADSDPRDPNCVKVVCGADDRALYFSRALIPYPRASGQPTPSSGWLLHLGVYAYRRAFLLDYAGWEPGVLEQVEKLEQLRVLERGHRIAVVRVDRAFPGIDTPEDYDRFVARWLRDSERTE